MTISIPTTIRLPDFSQALSSFPNKGANIFHDQVLPQSRAWARQYHSAFYDPKTSKKVEDSNRGLWASMSFPNASPESLRTVLDIYHLLEAFECSPEAQAAVERVTRALSDPDYKDEAWFCQMTRSVRTRISTAGPHNAQRLLEHLQSSMVYIAKETDLRKREQVLGMPEYIKLRREVFCGRILFDLVELSEGIDLPQHVHDNPIFSAAQNAISDLMFLTNDVFSYNIEQATGHDAVNMITVLMKSAQLDIQGAMDFLHGYVQALAHQLQDARAKIEDADASRVIDGCCDVLIGAVEWSWLSERYFGKDGKEIRKTGRMTLSSPVAAKD